MLLLEASSLLGIFVLCILKCIFLYRVTGKFCRSERKPLPVQTGKICRSGKARAASSTNLALPLNCEVELVEASSPQPALGDFEKARVFELLLVGADAALGGAHVGSERLLSRKAIVLLTRILEKHRVVELGADAQILVGQDEVRDLSEAVQADQVRADDLDIALVLLEPICLPYARHTRELIGRRIAAGKSVALLANESQQLMAVIIRSESS